MWSNVEMNFILLSAMLISAKKIPTPSHSPHLPPFICYTPLSPRTYVLMLNPFYVTRLAIPPKNITKSDVFCSPGGTERNQWHKRD